MSIILHSVEKIGSRPNHWGVLIILSLETNSVPVASNSFDYVLESLMSLWTRMVLRQYSFWWSQTFPWHCSSSAGLKSVVDLWNVGRIVHCRWKNCFDMVFLRWFNVSCRYLWQFSAIGLRHYGRRRGGCLVLWDFHGAHRIFSLKWSWLA